MAFSHPELPLDSPPEQSFSPHDISAAPFRDRINELLQVADTSDVKPLCEEQVRRLLHPELLKTLSLEEYMHLWKCLEPRYFSHVTRQGFRDHFSMFNHSSGLGEYSSGFTDILENGALLNTKFGLAGVSLDDPSTVENFLQDWVLQAPTKDEALARLRVRMEQNPLVNAPQYADNSAVHLAVDSVSHRTYGAETQNEVFVIFPTDVIASQYAFLPYNYNPSFAEEKHNDIFVWPLKHSPLGIPLDLGIVFLPKSTLVDPDTGSKYASVTPMEDEGTLVPSLVENKECRTAFFLWTERNLTPGSEFFERFRDLENPFDRAWGSPAFTLRKQVRKELLDVVGIPQDSLESLIEKIFSGTANAVKDLPWDEGVISLQDASELWLRQSNALWVRPKNAVSAEKYWNSYFDRYPDRRPARVVYYDGSPNDAVRTFLKSHGISEDFCPSTDRFADHIVDDMSSDSRANRGKEALMQYAHELINRHYAC